MILTAFCMEWCILVAPSQNSIQFGSFAKGGENEWVKYLNMMFATHCFGQCFLVQFYYFWNIVHLFFLLFSSVINFLKNVYFLVKWMTLSFKFWQGLKNSKSAFERSRFNLVCIYDFLYSFSNVLFDLTASNDLVSLG